MVLFTPPPTLPPTITFVVSHPQPRPAFPRPRKPSAPPKPRAEAPALALPLPTFDLASPLRSLPRLDFSHPAPGALAALTTLDGPRPHTPALALPPPRRLPGDDFAPVRTPAPRLPAFDADADADADEPAAPRPPRFELGGAPADAPAARGALARRPRTLRVRGPPPTGAPRRHAARPVGATPGPPRGMRRQARRWLRHATE